MEAWHVAGGTQIQSSGESRMKLDRGLLIFISRLRQVPCTQWGLTVEADGHGMTLRVSSPVPPSDLLHEPLIAATAGGGVLHSAGGAEPGIGVTCKPGPWGAEESVPHRAEAGGQS